MNKIGLLGAGSFVGQYVIKRLVDEGNQVCAFSRSLTAKKEGNPAWYPLSANSPPIDNSINYWISCAPVWALCDYFSMFESCGVRRMVIVSSTSGLSKINSNDLEEQKLAQRIQNAEENFAHWASQAGVEWIILRPTLIYDFKQDKNLRLIVDFINRFGFFPLCGKANGLRQPIHGDDVAKACIAALMSIKAANQAYNISGEETLSYSDMVKRLFSLSGKKPRLLKIPRCFFQLAIVFLKILPRFRHLSFSMVERMNQDLVFEHEAAVEDFGFTSRPFTDVKQSVAIKK